MFLALSKSTLCFFIIRCFIRGTLPSIEMHFVFPQTKAVEFDVRPPRYW